jgi:N-methylhydantoinase B
MATFDPIRLEIFKHLFTSIAEEMGVLLRKASFSPNIKERRDFSCAVFNSSGKMIAQAAHIPVHLGAMPLSVEAAIGRFNGNDAGLQPGDAIILNDPFHGGTHLPDITIVSPVFIQQKNDIDHHNGDRLVGFVASRAHHADVGGITPGSMPVAREIYQEGLIIPPVKLWQSGMINQAVWDLILANVRTPQERAGDLWAQLAANQRGVERLQEFAVKYGIVELDETMQALLDYTERMTRQKLSMIPDGIYRFTDYLDDNGIDNQRIPIKVSITIENDQGIVDFSGSADQQPGSINAVYAITLSAVFYVFRCLLDLDVPNNSGSLLPIKVIAPAGSIVNAIPPAPVAGGNVETSQRIVDVLMGALAQALPEHVPAASQGTMNNLTIGGWDSTRKTAFTYYETIAGGMGAGPWGKGVSAMHSHMTNTLNTPIEALEYAYPIRVIRYEIRTGSGGNGFFKGGEGLIRELEMLDSAQLTLLTERRRLPPYGLAGGEPGKCGENLLIRDDGRRILPGKGTFDLKPGDIVSISTPGGGGYGLAGEDIEP